jgi:Flp pilus assembly protein CpaB
MSNRAPTAPSTAPSWAGGARRRSGYYVIQAALLALLAGALVFAYLESLRRAALPVQPALTARVAIRPGTVITQDMVEVRRFPSALLPLGSLERPSQAVGRTAQIPLEAGEVLSASKLQRGEQGGLAHLVPEGQRAMVLPSGWLAGAPPPLAAGDRIDLLALHPQATSVGAGLVLTDVEILGTAGGAEAPERVYLAVTLEHAQAVLQARAGGYHLLLLARPSGP